MDQAVVFNIQKYSIHDGRGIRTTFFFKGCPLSCVWCHNPEGQRYEIDLMVYHERCSLCGRCVSACPRRANVLEDGRIRVNRGLCTACGACVDVCLANARELAGKPYTAAEMLQEAAKDRMFYEESGGGVTLSGGEVMTGNIGFVEEFCRALHRKGYSVNIDTCGYAPYEHFQRLLPFVDTFLYDIKLMDSEAHKRFTGVDNRLILDNLKRLSADGANINVRIPIIEGVNAREDFVQSVIDFLAAGNIRAAVTLLTYHNTGMSKYANLDMPYTGGSLQTPSPEMMERLRKLFTNGGFTTLQT